MHPLSQPLQVMVRGRFFGLREIRAIGPVWAVLTVLGFAAGAAFIHALITVFVVARILGIGR